MRLPLPTNRLVTLSVLGAVLTGVLAVGLAVPSLGLVESESASGANEILPADAPTPNDQFTPAVGGGDDEHEEYEHEEFEEEYDDDEHEEDEYEESEDDDDEHAIVGGLAEGDEYAAPMNEYGDDGA